MLHSRIDEDPLARARLSHAVRIRTSDREWLFVGSTNLDELIRQPLPAVSEQIRRLVGWLAAELRDDAFGHLSCPSLETLAAVIGAVDGDRVAKLISYAVSRGLIDSEDDGKKIGLTPSGWEFSKQKHGPTDEADDERAGGGEASRFKVIKAHCNTCGGIRNAYERASHIVRGDESEVSWYDKYDILECCGCGSVCIRSETWFSEWDSIDTDPVTGEPRLTPGDLPPELGPLSS